MGVRIVFCAWVQQSEGVRLGTFVLVMADTNTDGVELKRYSYAAAIDHEGINYVCGGVCACVHTRVCVSVCLCCVCVTYSACGQCVCAYNTSYTYSYTSYSVCVFS